MISAVALVDRERVAGFGFRAAIEQAGLEIVELTSDPRIAAHAARPDVAFRAPGGLLAAAVELGATIVLAAPTITWFTTLPADVTGRAWVTTDADGARDLLVDGPAFVKLPDAKHPRFPARRFTERTELDQALLDIGAHADLQLLATTIWLDIDSEYRVFTAGREALTCSPYRIQDEPFTPLLHTHRASFHVEAQRWTQDLLIHLHDVPPAAVLDIARLTNGDFVLLEANTAWGAGLYGCDPTRALTAVLAANAIAPDSPWRWTPNTSFDYTIGSA